MHGHLNVKIPHLCKTFRGTKNCFTNIFLNELENVFNQQRLYSLASFEPSRS